jgi:hypothetical protein
LGEIDSKLEEIKEEFKLVEQNYWDEIEEIVFLVIYCIGNSIFGIGISI